MFIFLILLLFGCSTQLKTITDDITSPEIEKVTPEDHHLIVVWGSDAMDRGDYDYNSIAHSDLVVDPNYHSPKRGDVLYYKMLESETKKNPMIPANYLGRVVKLPGESVMIKYGHVYK
jgi:signal peptidase I